MLGKFKVNLIQPNPWNPNQVDPINQEKLQKSLSVYGQQMPIIIREALIDGEVVYEVVDGEHRLSAAASLGWEEIDAINLGVVSEADAKRKTLIANSRYGQDDNEKLFAILSSEGVFESAADIFDTMPIDETELAGLFSKEDFDIDDIDGALGGTDEDAGEFDLGIEPTKTSSSTRILRFKIDAEDADWIETLIDQTRADQGMSQSDALTNAGDALCYLLKDMKHDS